MKTFLYTATALILLVGVWRHDWTLILASTALLAMWWLIGNEVVE